MMQASRLFGGPGARVLASAVTIQPAAAWGLPQVAAMVPGVVSNVVNRNFSLGVWESILKTSREVKSILSPSVSSSLQSLQATSSLSSSSPTTTFLEVPTFNSAGDGLINDLVDLRLPVGSLVGDVDPGAVVYEAHKAGIWQTLISLNVTTQNRLRELPAWHRAPALYLLMARILLDNSTELKTAVSSHQEREMDKILRTNVDLLSSDVEEAQGRLLEAVRSQSKLSSLRILMENLAPLPLAVAFTGAKSLGLGSDDTTKYLTEHLQRSGLHPAFVVA